MRRYTKVEKKVEKTKMRSPFKIRGVKPSKISSDESQKANVALESEDSLIGDDVKPKPTRKKKSAIMFDPKMFEEIDSHVARVIQIQFIRSKCFNDNTG